MKAYREYAVSKKSLELLTEEDRFIYRLSFTERLASKLNVMHYIGNYFDNIHLITPVNYIIIIIKSKKIQKKIEKNLKNLKKSEKNPKKFEKNLKKNLKFFFLNPKKFQKNPQII